MRESKIRLFLTVMALVTVINIVLLIAPGVALGEGAGSTYNAQLEASPDVVQVDADVQVPDESANFAANYSGGLEFVVHPVAEKSAPKYGIFDQWHGVVDEDEYLVGVDVSEWNGKINWERLKNHIDFAVLRVGGSYEWTSKCYKDERFEYNAKECERLGIPYGVYFYSTGQDAWDAAIEGDYVADALEGFNPTLPVFLDLEWEELAELDSSAQLTEVARTFCGRISSAGYLPGVYASVSWWEYLLTDSSFDQWAKWVAQYDGYCDVSCNCWQYDQDGEMPGFDCPVDLNIWYPEAA